MNRSFQTTRTKMASVLGATLFLTAAAALAQDGPPAFAPAQLDQLVSRIALYPDPLLAQVLAASTFPDQIQDAAGWAGQHRGFAGQDLQNAMAQENLPFDPSVQALIPFPNVLDTMASDMNWTSQLGNAVLAQRDDVMDAVQRMRRMSYSYGYLRTNEQVRVVYSPGAIEIDPVVAGYVYVPVYDPYVVFAPPRPGFFVAGAIGFRTGFFVGGFFGGWGWGGGFNWYSHTVLINHYEWDRDWRNRESYEHNYGAWNGGHWAATYAGRSSSFNRNVNVNVNRNVDVNRNYNYNTNTNYNRGYNANPNVNRGNDQNRNFNPGYNQNQNQNRGFNRGSDNNTNMNRGSNGDTNRYTPPARSFSPPAQQSYQPPARSFAPPERQSYQPPARSFAPPAQQSYQPPARSFAPPERQSYQPPARSFAPPAQQSYQPPARSFAPPERQSYQPPAQPQRQFSAPRGNDMPRSGGGGFVPRARR